MATATMQSFVHRLTRSMGAEMLRDHSDRQLVERLLAGRDEASFEAIVRRHGPMVYRVCWRVLQQEQDSEDAFQAVFLILARRLHGVRKHASLGSWLHGVANRVALKARDQAALRRRHERQAVPATETVVPEEVRWRELRAILDAELQQLGEAWRLPLVLCYLEGRTQDEAARQLGWSARTLRRRLAEARSALGHRLSRRGIVWSAALSTVLLSDCLAPAAPAPGLIGSTVEAATAIAAGHALPMAAVSARAAALTEGVLKAMLLTKLKIATILLVILTFLGAASVRLTCSRSAAGGSQAKQPDRPDGPAVPNSIIGIGEGVQRVAWTPDGKILAALVNIYDVGAQEVDGQKRTILFDHCTLMLWDVAKKEWLSTNVALEPKVRVQALAVSPDSKTLALGLDDLRGMGLADIRLIDLATGKDKMTFPFGREQGACLFGLTFTSKDTLVAWGRQEFDLSVVKLFDVNKPEGVRLSRTRDKDIMAFAISSDGKWQALAIAETIRVAVPGKKETVALEGHTKRVTALAFAADAKFLVSWGADNAVKVWDVANEKLLHTLATDDRPLNSVALSPDGKTVAVGIAIRKDEKVVGQEARLFDVQTGKLERNLKATGSTSPSALAFSPDGTTLAIGGLGIDAKYNTLGALRLWPLGKK